MKRSLLTLSRLTFALTLAVSAVAAPVAAAPSAADRQAHVQFNEGQRAFEAGDYRRAGAAFEAAYAAKPHHASLWNAARSWQRAGEDLRAVNLLERYLREAPPDAPDRDQATAALAEGAKRVGRLQLHFVGVSGGRLDGEPADEKTVYVAPGEHVVSGAANGKPVRKVVSVANGQMLSVTLSPPEEKASAPIPLETEARKPLPPWTVAVGGGLVVAGAVLTAISGADTVDKRDAFLGDPTQDRLDSAFASQTRTNVVLATTGGLALLTAVVAVFFVDWKGAPTKTGRALSPSLARFP